MERVLPDGRRHHRSRGTGAVPPRTIQSGSGGPPCQRPRTEQTDGDTPSLQLGFWTCRPMKNEQYRGKKPNGILTGFTGFTGFGEKSDGDNPKPFPGKRRALSGKGDQVCNPVNPVNPVKKSDSSSAPLLGVPSSPPGESRPNTESPDSGRGAYSALGSLFATFATPRATRGRFARELRSSSAPLRLCGKIPLPASPWVIPVRFLRFLNHSPHSLFPSLP